MASSEELASLAVEVRTSCVGEIFEGVANSYEGAKPDGQNRDGLLKPLFDGKSLRAQTFYADGDVRSADAELCEGANPDAIQNEGLNEGATSIGEHPAVANEVANEIQPGNPRNPDGEPERVASILHRLSGPISAAVALVVLGLLNNGCRTRPYDERGDEQKYELPDGSSSPADMVQKERPACDRVTVTADYALASFAVKRGTKDVTAGCYVYRVGCEPHPFTSQEFQHVGIGGLSDLSPIEFTDGEGQTLGLPAINKIDHTVSFTDLNQTLPVQSNSRYCLKVDISPNAAVGATHRFEIAASEDIGIKNVPIDGDFPIEGITLGVVN